MGRKKNYDRDDKLRAAVSLFRKLGFERASTAALVERLGINRKSLYAEFGSKEALFHAALDMYSAVNVTQTLESLELPEAGLAELVAFVRKLSIAARGPEAGLGCLLCNTAVELAAVDSQSQKRVGFYVQRIESAIGNALINAQSAGLLRAEVDVTAEAGYLTSHILGQLTLIRANVAPELVERAALAAEAHLKALA